MRKTKHNPPGKKTQEPSFIKFSKSQMNYLREVRARQRQEFSDALEVVYEEQGILEKVMQAPPGMYTLKQDLSGLEILPVAQPDEKITDPEEPAEEEKEAETKAEAEKSAAHKVVKPAAGEKSH